MSKLLKPKAFSIPFWLSCRTELTSDAKLVYAALVEQSTFHDDPDIADLDRMSELTGLHRRSIDLALKQLESHSLIRIGAGDATEPRIDYLLDDHWWAQEFLS